MKFYYNILAVIFDMSHLTRGAWIEIKAVKVNNRGHIVAPHTRCVD